MRLVKMNLAHWATAFFLIAGVSSSAMAEDTITLKGQLSFGAAINWTPPANFSLQLEHSFVWVDLETHELTNEGEIMAQVNATVLVHGQYQQRGNEIVFVAENIQKYIKKSTAPTMAQCRSVQDSLVKRYMNWPNGANGIGIGQGDDGECLVSIGFPSDEAWEEFIQDRQNAGLSPYYEKIRKGRQLVIVNFRLRVIGVIVPHPVGGISN